MQSSCMGSLMELAEQDPNILYLTADSGEGGLDLMFRRYFPDRAFEFGIAEENLVGAAAGRLRKDPLCLYGGAVFGISGL